MFSSLQPGPALKDAVSPLTFLFECRAKWALLLGVSTSHRSLLSRGDFVLSLTVCSVSKLCVCDFGLFFFS